MSAEVVRDLIEKFNDGDYEDDIEPYFNDVITFFNYVKKYNLLDEIDLGQIPSNEFDNELFDFLVESNVINNLDYDSIPEEFKNHWLLYHLEKNYEWAIKYITDNLITDVDVRPDGFYLHLRDREELSSYFCSGGRRDMGAKEVAKQVLSDGGLGNDWYFDYDRKPSDTIDELDDANKTSLENMIFKEIGDVELSLEDYNSDFFEHLSEIQNTEGYFRIRPEDMNSLLSNENAINEIFRNDLEDLGGNLRNLYWNAENSAYEDEVYNLVYDGLQEFFEGRVDEVRRDVTKSDGSKVTRYDSYIKIRNFVSIISEFLENNKGGTYTDSFLEYFGGFTALIDAMVYNDEVECIDFRIPDYPDWDMTRKNINNLFHDYI